MQDDYKVTLIGATDLIMHGDNIQWGERVKCWTKDPANKGISVAGDDRSPAWTWIGCLYHNAGLVVIDSDNIMSMLRDGGTKCPNPNGKGSMKAQTQYGIICNEIGWPLEVSGHNISTREIFDAKNELDFEFHEALAEDLGFKLFVKRAKIGKNKHIRVRPRFSAWTATGTISVVDPQINKEMLQTIFQFAGTYCGLGDWRPSSPLKPGQWGRFEVQITKI